MTAGDIDRALRAAIEAAAVSGARTRKLSGEALIRFLIAAEGGSLAKELHRAGTTILLVEQNAEMALRIADRAYVLETGRIKLSGTGEELAKSDEIRKAYLGG